MQSHLRRLFLLTALLWGIAAVVPGNAGLLAAAHAQPQSINRLASKTSPLTAQEQAEVTAYLQYWLDRLATGEPDAIRSAVRALDDPLNRMGVTRLFRDEYSRAAVPQLEALLDSRTTTEVAVNAMKVGSLLGTERALRLMVDRSDPRREEREAVRLWAAKGFQLLVEGDSIEGRQLTGPMRDLARNAAQEEHWLVLRRQFEALAAVPDSLEHQIAVLRAAVDRVRDDENPPSPIVESLHRAIVLLRNQWINMTSSREQQTFGKTAGPAIVGVIEIAAAHWEKAQESERPRGWYRAAVQNAETLLIAIDLQVRTNRPNAPQSALDDAWNRRDREAFSGHLEMWRDITGREPYTPRGP